MLIGWREVRGERGIGSSASAASGGDSIVNDAGQDMHTALGKSSDGISSFVFTLSYRMVLVCLPEAANTTESEGCRERGAASVSPAWFTESVDAMGQAS